jgi:hypothetical protein
MANSTGPLNSSAPTTSIPVGAVYNATTPAPADKQVCALQCDDEGNLLVNNVGGGGGGSSEVNFNPSTGLLTHANVTGSSSGNTTLVSGVAGKKIYLYRMLLSVNGATNVEIVDSTSSTVLLGPYYLTGAGGSVVLDNTGEPWAITTVIGDTMAVNLSAAQSFTVDVWYKAQ